MTPLKINNCYLITLILIQVLASCSSSKCDNFFSYESRSLDIKGLTKKIESKEKISNLNVGSITLKKDFVEVSERLKELDILQYSLCSQLKSFNGTTEEKNALIAKNSETIREMLKIAQQSSDLPESQQNRLLVGYKQELSSNHQVLIELLKNTEIILKYASLIADTTCLRNKRIKILSTLFPYQNIETNVKISPRDLAKNAFSEIVSKELLKDSLEIQKFTLVANSISMTIDKTITTLKSLSDLDRTRYIINESFWISNIDKIQRISSFDAMKFQPIYPQMKTLRNSYDIVYSRVIDYFISIREFLSPKNGIINLDSLDKVLTSERFALDLIATYSIELAESSKRIKNIIEEITTQN
ncbi:hypothetical protein [Flavobacterium panici]|uniref:Lipoprotein n=1 Tax=Flavobacterium panici TaxID=2654843 RepID=A0A9N8P118_9FLAO|nr:hypothetical protein [Flavobacterium panici]CAC9973651.1 hypothetical protein FLAPXU55_01336 [Flavobacterium panici]